jgi:hypothetical protein
LRAQIYIFNLWGVYQSSGSLFGIWYCLRRKQEPFAPGFAFLCSNGGSINYAMP